MQIHQAPCGADEVWEQPSSPEQCPTTSPPPPHVGYTPHHTLDPLTISANSVHPCILSVPHKEESGSNSRRKQQQQKQQPCSYRHIRSHAHTGTHQSPPSAPCARQKTYPQHASILPSIHPQQVAHSVNYKTMTWTCGPPQQPSLPPCLAKYPS